MRRTHFFVVAFVVVAVVVSMSAIWPSTLWAMVVLGPLLVCGFYDAFQSTHAILRNYPIIGHGRYMLESVRPEFHQYFVEPNTGGKPFSREERSAVYQRAKDVRDTVPFGTQRDVYATGYEYISHSLTCTHPTEPPRIKIGGPHCTRPYDASLLNISAMSYGSLSDAAVLALNGGAKDGGFAHNTGEGGVSPYHLDPGGDLIWQIGTGYFGCRGSDGSFDSNRFADTVARDEIKMVEIKLSQGAKPGHGGILPATKVTPEIAFIRGIPVGETCLSSPSHTAFSTPIGLLEFVARLRELSGGRPVGFKLCVGRPEQFLSICLAMRQTGIIPDFIAVDGGEGGTGAAPIEFSNHVGMPLTDGLVAVHNLLVGLELRDNIRLIASGKVTTGFKMARLMALGAESCYSARAMMFALGCIQARRCNANDCPTGVATQDRNLIGGLVVSDKRKRVCRFHIATLHSLMELVAAAGLNSPLELRPHHIHRRVEDDEVRTFEEIYEWLEPGQLLSSDGLSPKYTKMLERARADRF